MFLSICLIFLTRNTPIKTSRSISTSKTGSPIQYKKRIGAHHCLYYVSRDMRTSLELNINNRLRLDLNKLSEKLSEYQVNSGINLEKSNCDLHKLKREFSAEKKVFIHSQNELEKSYNETKFDVLVYIYIYIAIYYYVLTSIYIHTPCYRLVHIIE